MEEKLNLEPEVNALFEVQGRTYKCIQGSAGFGTEDCDLCDTNRGSNYCEDSRCSKYVRKDETNVFFILYDDPEGEQS